MGRRGNGGWNPKLLKRMLVKKWDCDSWFDDRSSDSWWTNGSSRRRFLNNGEEAPTATETEKPACAEFEFLETRDSCWRTPSTKRPVAEETLKRLLRSLPVANNSPSWRSSTSGDSSYWRNAATTSAESTSSSCSNKLKHLLIQQDQVQQKKQQHQQLLTRNFDLSSRAKAKLLQELFSSSGSCRYAGLANKVWMLVFNRRLLPCKEEIANLFGITSFSGYRPGDSGDHGKRFGHRLNGSSRFSTQRRSSAEYAVKIWLRRGISYIIWKQRFTLSIR